MRLAHLILAAILSVQCAVFSAASVNPIPFIDLPLMPVSRAPGGPGFTLAVNGTNFISGSVVLWDGRPRETNFISPAELQAVIRASDIRRPCTASISVRNPGPGGGVSNVALFTIRRSGLPIHLNWRNVSSPSVEVVVAADFNRDGKLDLAATENYETRTVTILLGEGDGIFRPPANYEVSGSHAGSMAVGDFNNDGNLDLAVSGGGILLGRGDGTFYWAMPNFLFGATSVVVGDFNRDGNLDLAYADNGVQVTFGNGDGTFQPPVRVFYGGALTLVAGNFNGDAALDLAVAYNEGAQAYISVLLGNGDGTFQLSLSIPAPFDTLNMIAADLNGDGRLDLASDGDLGRPYVSVFYGNGDGTFQPQLQEPVLASGAFGLAVGDFNADGRIDLATAADFLDSPYYVSILLGDKDGDFLPTRNVDASSFPRGVAAGFFNGHGYLDLAVATDNGVELLMQTSP